MINKFKLTFFVFFAICFNHIIAGDETRSSRAYANNLVPGAFIQTSDDKFTGVVGWNASFTTLANRGVVEIGIDEEKHIWHSSSFMICVKYSVDITDASLTTTTYTNQQITVNYNPQDLSRYTDRAQIVYPNAYNIKVYNISITTCALNSNCTSCTTPYTLADVYIEADVTTSKAYNFSTSVTFLSTDISHTINPVTQDLEISWNSIIGAEEYELEYTFVDNYTSVFGTTAQSYDLDHDATRIVTAFNTYAIPTTYELGTIIYRIRPIGRSTTNARVEGTWAGAPAAGLISAASPFTKAISAFDGDKFNWSSIKTFAENGKFGVGVSFSDAVGYKRQSIARLNTESKAIVQTTLYDYYGRPTINMLPAPVTGKDLNYRLALNMYRATATVSAVVFDKQIFGLCTSTNNICSSGAFLLDSINSIGAPKYYSPSNPNKGGYQGYIPDAEGLPYTQVKYKPDALGRIEKQTMPGSVHAIGGGKEIKFYYAQPTQVELDRIFGSEAGRAKYNFKNITIDPNGQTSATYIDNFGRTIATSLMGLNPLNVDAVPNIASAVSLTETLHVAPTNDPDPNNRCKEVNTTFFVSSASIEGYVYGTTLGSFASTCVTNPVCYDCVYDFTISVKDDCGNEIFDYDANSTTPSGLITSLGKQPPYVPTTCGTAPTSTMIAGASLTTPVNIAFPKAGVYTVYKKMCVSDDPILDYTDHFIDNRCDDKKCHLLDSILAMSDFSACNQTMTCQECNDLVTAYAPTNGTLAVTGVQAGGGTVYTTTVNASPLTPEQLSQALENCAKLCPPKTTCDKYTKALLMDFYPGGQYADTVVGGPHWAYSIFNTSTNSLPSNVTFQTPTNYQNAIGNPDFVQINSVNTPPQSLTKAQYIQYYRTSWANALLQYHPEYCKLNFYCHVVGPSLDYDDAISNVNHYDSACVTGCFFPVTYSAFCTYTPQGCSAVTYTDPIMTLSATAAFSSTIAAFYAQITTNFSAASNTSVPNFDIYRYVMAETNSVAATSTVIADWLGHDPCRQDKDWLLFKQFYIAKKAALYHKLDSIYFLNPASFGCSGSTNAPSGYTSVFPDISGTLSSLFPTSTNSLYVAMNTPTAQMNPSVSPTYSAALNSLTSSMQSSMNSSLSAQCDTTCNSYKNYWNMTLNTGCIAYGNASSTVKNNILAALVEVCKKGCDYTTNLAGASTTSPSTSYILPSTTVSVTSFQQVLNYYLTGSITSSVCSALILTQPAPYPTSTPTTQALTSCKCDQILQIQHDYDSLNTISMLPTGVDAPWKLFRYRNGYDLQEFNVLKCVCNAATSNTWAPGHTWVSSELTAVANNTMSINPKLTCISCMKCTDVVSAINGMFSQLTNTTAYSGNPLGAITQDSTNQIYAIASLNQTFGVHAFQDYIDLYNDCNTFTTSAQTFSNTLTDQAWDLFRYLNQLVTDNYLTKGTRPAKICTDSKYFLSTLYTGALPNTPSSLNYYYTPSGSNMNFQIKDGSTVILSVNLSFPSTYTGTWQSFSYLNNFVAYCPSPVTAGNNYQFQVQAIDNVFGVVTLTGSIANQAYPITTLSSGSSPVPQLCPKKPNKLNTCAINLINSALVQANFLNMQNLDSLKAQFQEQYKTACYNAINETFIRKYNGADEYEYTLFYYDESGNLQRTVAPNGVSILTSVVSPLTSPLYPAHSDAVNGVAKKYVSDYRYTSYNEPISESTIDGGMTNYFYDEVGRVMASQNAKQAAASTTINVYSYTLYDDIGRITEVGEMRTSTNLSSSGPFLAASAFPSIVSAATRTQVTQTYYDQIPAGISTPAATYFGVSTNTLSNLRNRVSSVMYKENPAGSYDYATYYSYDDHGNVKHLVQENNTLPSTLYGSTSPATYENLFKIIDYSYELVSGNMVQAVYQKNLPDQMIHNYFYDNDNRLHEVYTSYDNVNFDLDAKYFYYEHGPLARIERADKQVQGSDYMYTIHGWIKGINGEALNMNSDAGKDGTATSTYLSSFAGIHNFFGQDAMSFSLNYYNSGGNSDYKAIKRSNFNTTTDVTPQMSMTNLYNNTLPFYLDVSGAGNGASLYNGNISSMVTSIIDKDPTNNITDKTPFPLLSGYRYDQLHRILKTRTFRSYSSNTWNAPSGTNYDDSYKMDLTYDPNGNIQSLYRNGASTTLKPGGNLNMDDLTYSYYKSLSEGGVVTNNSYNSNKLACVTDNIASTNYTDDIDHYNCSEQYKRYIYDEIGNMIYDAGEYIANVIWSTDRKVRYIIRDSTAMLATGTGPTSVFKPDIEYQYNAMRQRVTKIVKPRDQTTKQLRPVNEWVYTYYVYDASGNVLATYDRSVTLTGSVYKDAVSLSERDVYGAERLAIARPTNTLAQWSYTFAGCGYPPTCRTSITTINPTLPTFTAPYSASRSLGYKEFELDNHLGNVLTTVSDRKIPAVYNATSCVAFFDFSTPPDMSPQNMTLSTSSGSLVATMQFGFSISGVDIPLASNLTAGVTYKIEYDFNPGTITLSDGLYIVPYDYNGSFYLGPYFCNGSFVPPAGHYSFNYTPTITGPSVTTYIAFNTNSSSTHSFSIDNLSMCPVNSPATVATYTADILMHTDYYAFGQEMPARKYQASNYRYSYNGKEKDTETSTGAQDFGMREYDERIGRFFNRDPYSINIYNKTPYAFAGNSPVAFIDYNGGFMIDPNITGGTRKQQAKLRKILHQIDKLANSNTSEGNALIDAFIKAFDLEKDPNARSIALSILSYNSGPTVIISKDVKKRDIGLGMVKNDVWDCSTGPNVEVDPRLLNDKPEYTGNRKYTGDKWTRDSEVILFWVVIHEGGHLADQITDCDTRGPDGEGMDPGDHFERSLIGIDLGNPNDLSRLRNRSFDWKSVGRPNPDRTAVFYDILKTIQTTNRFFSNLSTNSSGENGLNTVIKATNMFQNFINKIFGEESMTSYGNDRFLD